MLDSLSAYLTKEYGHGFSRSNLAGMRKFYLTYKDREPQIVQSGIGQLGMMQKNGIVQSPIGQLPVDHQSFPFKLSWTHQDLGQMQMYVNYYDRCEIIEGENPTIGILMCKQSDEALVELTLPKDSHIFAKEYKLYLPDKNCLRKSCRNGLRRLMFSERL